MVDSTRAMKLACLAVLFFVAASVGCLTPHKNGSSKSGSRDTSTNAAKSESSTEATSESLPEGDTPSGDEGPIAVPAGEFWMGAETPDKAHPAKHKVTLDAYEIDRYEVTAEEYAACVAKKSCTAARTGGQCTFNDASKKEHPINCVTWVQARSYCDSVGRRLPTEAEWERAARGSDARTFIWGEDWPPPKGAGNFSDENAKRAQAWVNAIEDYDDGYSYLAPTGSYDGVSPTGAEDMAGNVMEWTQDYWSAELGKAAAKNPKGPPRGEGRVVRGSSYGHYRRAELAVTFRAGYREDVASEHLGFRCAK